VAGPSGPAFIERYNNAFEKTGGFRFREYFLTNLLIKPPGIICFPLGGSVILEKFGSILSHSFLFKIKDLEKFKIVKTNFKFETE
jgi:hypothetical protein